ncbi:MAG: helix-turn-helix domain-containing protein [Thermoplasmata archaeon]|nr:helix-turn-helix domain-containing protein [Thermoplasmata archaeon]
MTEKFREFVEMAKLFSEPLVVRILENLYSNGESTATDVARALDIHIATAKKYLKKLAEKGIVQEEIKRKHIRKTEVYSLAKKQVVLLLNLEILSLENEKLEALADALFQSYASLFSQQLNTATRNPYELILLIKSRVGSTAAEVVLNHAVKNLSREVLEYLTKKEVIKRLEEMIKCRE